MSDRPEYDLVQSIVVVNAQTGVVLRTERAVAFDHAVGKTFFEGEVPLEVQPTMTGSQAVFAQCLADITRGHIISNTDPCGPLGAGIHTYIDLPPDDVNAERVVRAIDTDGVFGDGSFAMTRADAAGEAGLTTAADAHYAITKAYDFYWEVFERATLGMTDSLQIRVNYPDDSFGAGFQPPNRVFVTARTPNASWCPNGTDCSTPVADIEVLGHERPRRFCGCGRDVSPRRTGRHA